MALPLEHVAVDRRELETASRCPPESHKALLELLKKLGVKAKHPGLLSEKAIDSVGFYLDDANVEQSRAQLQRAQEVRMECRLRRYEVMLCEAADQLPSAHRRQCVPILGTNEMARRLDASERGQMEIVATLQCGATVVVRPHKRAHDRMVVMFTSVQKKKRALDAFLDPRDVPQLIAFFKEAASGQRVNATAVAPRSGMRSRWVPIQDGGFWTLPSWYGEACALVAQDVFRLHALVSATSQPVSRALYVDRVTAHRMTAGPINTHRTLIKTIFHRACGGCVCGLHRSSEPEKPFKRLELKWEFCGCALDERGRCNRHYLAQKKTEGSVFPKVCMKELRLELHCMHEDRTGLHLPLNVEDDKMDIGYAKRFVCDLAACGAKLMAEGEHTELAADATHLMQELETQRLTHNHVGDTMLQSDVSAVYLLGAKVAVNKKSNKFVGRVAADHNSILKTHRHLFKKV